MSEAVERLAAVLRPQPLWWETRTAKGGFVMTLMTTPEGAAEHILAADPALAEAIELGLAWQAAEAALPEGSWMVELIRYGAMAGDTNPHTGRVLERPTHRYSAQAGADWTEEYTDTPAASPAEALRNFAAKLREAKP